MKLKSIHYFLERNTTEDVAIMIIGNKIDMQEHREISTYQAQELANKLNVPYMESSAKKATNIDQIFETMTKMMISKFGDKIKPDKQSIRLGNSYNNRQSSKEKEENCCN